MKAKKPKRPSTGGKPARESSVGDDFLKRVGLQEDGGWVNALKQELTSCSPTLRLCWQELIELGRKAKPRSKKDWNEVQLETESQCGYPPLDQEESDEDDEPLVEDPDLPPMISHEPGTDAYQQALARVAPDEAWLAQVQALAELAKKEAFARKLAQIIRCAVQSGIGSLNRNGPNKEILRALIWCVAALPDTELINALRQLATWSTEHNTAQAKTIGIALAFTASEHAAAALRMAEMAAKRESPRTRFGRYASHVEQKVGINPEDSAERFVPTFDLDAQGARRVAFASGEALDLRIEGSKGALRYFNASGKQVASAPAAVKREHAQELQELRATAKGLGQLLNHQRARIESMFLIPRSWDFSTWRERYIDHPIVGTVAKRLIWLAGDAAFMISDGHPIDTQGKTFSIPGSARISLWHPLNRNVKEIQAWRKRLESLGVTQPFKQAHREVYLLTDAERRTETYSNRFAGHILRQAQFRVLTHSRKWKVPLLGGWDAGDQASAQRNLPEGWRVELWVSGAGEEHATGLLHISTDQVRFYSGGQAEPSRLESVPALIFSETLRDVDLFVGAASVGNDPAWVDGGPQRRFRDYWQEYSFGDLSETARTRKDALERLVPRLRIARQCEFDGNFLLIKGKLRKYKIHLGSANIQMEPGSQYLCIVPDQGPAITRDGAVLLPFEGDRTLSIILSKAFLLADDDQITDPTILSQIKRRQ